MRLRPLSLLVLAFGTTLHSAGPVYPPFGLDLTARDPAVRPGTSFFDYANGGYLARLKIPDDQVTASRRMNMTLRIEGQLHTLLDTAAAKTSATPTDLEGKVGAFYASFMDEPAIEARGASPLTPELDAIRGAPDRAALADLMGRPDLYVSPFAVSIDSDVKNPDAYAVYLGQSGLGLPDRDYYLQSTFAAQRAAYRTYAATLLRLIGWPDADASADAALAFETAIAKASWTKVEQRDPTTQYHPMTPAALVGFAPGFAWQRYLQAGGLGDKHMLVVTTDTALPKLAALFATTPLPTLKAWMAFRAADLAAPYLSRAFTDASFELHGRVLEGQAAQKARWKRGIVATAGGDCGADPSSCFGTLNWATGQLYAARYFPPENKAKIERLVADLRTAFRARLERLDWMGPATKAEALRKLDTYAIKVGYPDSPRDYSHVMVRRDDLLGNVRRAVAYEWGFQLGRSDGPVDRADWIMTPQTNDAYNGSLRDVVFPAGILQAPVFDPASDPAVNYGAVGGIIGHELTHGFDDQGRHIDAAGRLRDWWTPADAVAFEARAKVVGAQYATYAPVSGMHINPDLTMGENLADLGGFAMALDAYHASLKGRPAPVLDGLTGDQRVFLSWAQVYARKSRPEAIRKQTASDPHSYSKFRVDGVVRNIDDWYAAFGIKPGDPLYVAPEKRARVW